LVRRVQFLDSDLDPLLGEFKSLLGDLDLLSPEGFFLLVLGELFVDVTAQFLYLDPTSLELVQLPVDDPKLTWG
jgi:hypothetical protein